MQLSILERDLTKILASNWHPGAARLYYVKATAAWQVTYKNWSAWIDHMIEHTKNSEQWLYRVVSAVELLIEVAKAHYPAMVLPDVTKVESIEGFLGHFDKAQVGALSLAARLANKTGDRSYIHQAAIGELHQSQIVEMIADFDKGKALPKRGQEEGENAEDSEGDEQRANKSNAVRPGEVSFESLRLACQELGIESVLAYRLLKRLGISVRPELIAAAGVAQSN